MGTDGVAVGTVALGYVPLLTTIAGDLIEVLVEVLVYVLVTVTSTGWLVV